MSQSCASVKSAPLILPQKIMRAALETRFFLAHIAEPDHLERTVYAHVVWKPQREPESAEVRLDVREHESAFVKRVSIHYASNPNEEQHAFEIRGLEDKPVCCTLAARAPAAHLPLPGSRGGHCRGEKQRCHDGRGRQPEPAALHGGLCRGRSAGDLLVGAAAPFQEDCRRRRGAHGRRAQDHWRAPLLRYQEERRRSGGPLCGRARGPRACVLGRGQLHFHCVAAGAGRGRSGAGGGN